MSDVVKNSINKLPDEVVGEVRTRCSEMRFEGDSMVELLREVEQLLEVEETRKDHSRGRRRNSRVLQINEL